MHIEETESRLAENFFKHKVEKKTCEGNDSGTVMLYRVCIGFLTCFGSTCPLRLNTANHYRVILTDYLYSMMKHFYTVGNGVFTNDPTPIQSARGFTESFDEDRNDVRHML